MGALQLISTITKVLLITNDKFAQSALACFTNDYKTDMVRLKERNKVDEEYGVDYHRMFYYEYSNMKPTLEWVRDCGEGARAVGRIIR